MSWLWGGGDDKDVDPDDPHGDFAKIPKEDRDKCVEAFQERWAEQIQRVKDDPDSGTPMSKEICNRFCKGRAYNLEQASAMYEEHLAWFERVKPYSLTVDNFASFLEHSLQMYTYTGLAKKGQVAVVVRSRYAFPARYSTDEYRNALAYLTCWAARRRPEASVICILDFRDFSSENRSIEYAKIFAEVCSNQWPERLSAAFCINAGMIFRGMWTVVQYFVDKRTRRKVQVWGTDGYQEALLELIDAEVLPEEYGGTHGEYPPLNWAQWNDLSIGASEVKDTPEEAGPDLGTKTDGTPIVSAEAEGTKTEDPPAAATTES